MVYWNKDNMEGIKEIALHFKSIKDAGGFAEYCELCSNGLRKMAFDALIGNKTLRATAEFLFDHDFDWMQRIDLPGSGCRGKNRRARRGITTVLQQFAA